MIDFPSESSVFDLARLLIKKWESFSSHPYLCPANKPTIGWGATRYADGRKVKMSDPAIDAVGAETLLTASLRRIRNDLEPCLARTPTLHQGAALLSLAFNVGVGAHDGIRGDLADSTLLERFNAGDFSSASDHFLDWVYIHKDGHAVRLDGLINRRHAEQIVFNTKD